MWGVVTRVSNEMGAGDLEWVNKVFFFSLDRRLIPRGLGFWIIYVVVFRAGRFFMNESWAWVVTELRADPETFECYFEKGAQSLPVPSLRFRHACGVRRTGGSCFYVSLSLHL